KQIGLATLNFHDSRKGLPPFRIVDGDRTWLGLILPFIEEQGIADLWDYKRGCFYDQTLKCRTAIVQAFYCPSMPHDTRIVGVLQTNDGHSHPRTDPEVSGQPYQGSISDYKGVLRSTCPILSPLTNTVITSWDNGNSQYVDGAMPQC